MVGQHSLYLYFSISLFLYIYISLYLYLSFPLWLIWIVSSTFHHYEDRDLWTENCQKCIAGFVFLIFASILRLSVDEDKIIRLATLIRKIIKFPTVQRDRVQSHIWLTTSSYMVKIFVHFLISLEAHPHICIWLGTRSHLNFPVYEENLVFFFISVLLEQYILYLIVRCSEKHPW